MTDLPMHPGQELRFDSDGTQLTGELNLPQSYRARVELWAPGDRYYVFELEGDVLHELSAAVEVQSHYSDFRSFRESEPPFRQYAEIKVSGRLMRGEGRVGAPQDEG